MKKKLAYIFKYKRAINFELPHSLCSPHARVHRFVIQYSVYNLLILYSTPLVLESNIFLRKHTHTRCKFSIYALFMASNFHGVSFCATKNQKKTPTIASGGPRNQQTKQTKQTSKWKRPCGSELNMLHHTEKKKKKLKHIEKTFGAKVVVKKVIEQNVNFVSSRDGQSNKWIILVPITLKIAIR